MEFYSNEMSLEDWTKVAQSQGLTVEFDESLNTWFAETSNRDIRGTYCLDCDCTTKAWLVEYSEAA